MSGGEWLSEVFDLVEVRGVLTGGAVARGGWQSRGPLYDPVKFFAMVNGRATLSTDGVDRPIELETGDVAILTGRRWVAFEAGDPPRREVRPESEFTAAAFAGSDRGADDILIGGCINLNEAGRTLLVDSLPPLAHIRAAQTGSDRLLSCLTRLFDEATAARIGSAFAVRQYAQLVLLEVLRAYVGQAQLPPGTLRLHADERLRPALDRMHADPGRPWRLEELAQAAAMSRTTFAERFREVAGTPPLSYLVRWRMVLAQRALRDGDTRVGALAGELGYGSESAFSTAFKRVVGESPLRYRLRVRDESAESAESSATV
ncbi:AraC family transcriptional regulator [Streptomyces sp. NPDC005389]|uniref:AraC family transcriptional regulator n=1 Tax=Streptomyces sp. NPDC005389 TaxID=3157040 RepID=UPI0033A92F6D